MHARMILSRLLTALALLWLAGCSPIKLLNTVVSDTGYLVRSDLSYGQDLRQQLDLYTPLPQPENSKTLVFFYGGNWQSGDKKDFRFVAEALTAQGFIVAIPDYRLYPPYRWPSFVEDGAAAVRWLREHIAEYGGDPQAIYLSGHSAGAYIAVMLLLDERYLGPQAVRGAIGLAGPYDFLPIRDPDLQMIFAPATDVRQTQPIYYVDGNEPPLLLLSGSDDRTVNPGNSIRLAARIREKGGSVQVILYQDVGHEFIVGALASPLQQWAPTLQDMTDFIFTY